MVERIKIVHDKVDNDSRVFEELKKEICPLYIWGIGNVANEVFQVLGEKGIRVSGAFVDMDIVDGGDFNGYHVESLSELVNKGKKINVIMGHAQYHKMKMIARNPVVNRVFYVLNPFKTHEDISERYVKENADQLNSVYRLFEEGYSKRVLESYINTRVNSDIKYLLDVFRYPMDFFNNDVFRLNCHENYVDVGAYNGDTVRDFCKTVSNKYEKIYAFEPDEQFFQELNNTVRKEKLENIFTYKLGIWDRDTTLSFRKDEGQSGKIVQDNDTKYQIPVVALDSILEDKEVSLIKINFSAGGFESLSGGERLIQRWRPKVAVTLGIERDNLIKIPEFLKKVNPDYKLFLRYLESMPSRLTLFAV